ncbi:MAG: hypothetical protein V3S85_04630, partial [Nitrospirales bacterium]
LRKGGLAPFGYLVEERPASVIVGFARWGGRSFRKITFHLGSQSGSKVIGEWGLAGESPIRRRFAGE